MYAVFARRSIIYLGEDQQAAIDMMASNEQCAMSMPSTLPALIREFEKYLEAHPENSVDLESQSAEDEAIEAFNHFMDVLDEAGINADNINTILERARSGSQDALKVVKSFADRGIRGLGDCFERLGTFLKENAGPTEDHFEHSCDGQNCHHDCAEEGCQPGQHKD